MQYPYRAIPEEQIPQAVEAAFQHVVDTYASEVNKLVSVWRCFSDDDLSYRPDAKSSTVGDILRHELLSSRRFFGEFFGGKEPEGSAVLPDPITVAACCERIRMLARRRLAYLASRSEEWWLESETFFEVSRQRIWIFWRRVLHTAHHRTQLTVYLRLLGRNVPPIYGPTADVTWAEADPTNTAEASERQGRTTNLHPSPEAKRR